MYSFLGLDFGQSTFGKDKFMASFHQMLFARKLIGSRVYYSPGSG